MTPPMRRPGMPPPIARGDFNQSPLLVFYEITQACDLVCTHCRACAQTRPHPGELTPKESMQLVEQLAEFPKPPLLVLTGGDPLKRHDIFELIEHAVRLGLDVSITPSATPLVTEQALRRLRRAGISRLAVSLDGADAHTHDSIRGVQGSFQHTLWIIGLARDQQIPVQVNTTIMPANFRQIDRMSTLLADQEIVLWSVFFLVPVGRAAYAPRLTAQEYESAFQRLWEHSQCQPYAIKTTEAPHFRRYTIEQRLRQKKNGERTRQAAVYTPFYVNDGKGVMFISHVGIIHPSGFLPVVCGVFPLAHVVEVYQSSPIFRGLRDTSRLQGKCGICEFRTICGGSRARAYALTGNMFAEEPDCAYIPPDRS